MKMRKRLFLLQALAILIAVLQDEGRNHNWILNNVFYPYLTAR